jgi:hypothetical protein
LKAGDFICEIYGQVQVMEELDNNSTLPTHSQLWINGTGLMIDSKEFEHSVIYTRMHHSVYYNCELSAFELNGKVRFGLFAVYPTLLTSMNDKQKRSELYVIAAGEELFLPFDIAPVIQRYESDWRGQKWRRFELEIGAFKPPGQNVKVDEEIHIEPEPEASPPHEVEPQGEKQKKAPSKAGEGSVVGFFQNEFELTFRLEGTGELQRPRMELPAVISRLPKPGMKPFMQPPKPVERTEPVQFWIRNMPAPKPSKKAAVLKFLSDLKPHEPWAIDDEQDLVDMTDMDLQTH